MGRLKKVYDKCIAFRKFGPDDQSYESKIVRFWMKSCKRRNGILPQIFLAYGMTLQRHNGNVREWCRFLWKMSR